MNAQMRVEAGAKWLDENVPGWLGMIVLSELRLESPCDCICGQIGGTFNAFCVRHDIRESQAFRLGFALAPGMGISDFDELDIAWTALIDSRREVE